MSGPMWNQAEDVFQDENKHTNKQKKSWIKTRIAIVVNFVSLESLDFDKLVW
jgi:hypothetical protein